MYYVFQVTTLGGDVNTWSAQQIEYLQEPTLPRSLLVHVHLQEPPPIYDPTLPHTYQPLHLARPL